MNNSWGFDLTQFDDVWKIILQIALLLGFLLIGNILRRTIPFLRKAFIPSALIGGLLLFLVNNFRLYIIIRKGLVYAKIRND